MLCFLYIRQDCFIFGGMVYTESERKEIFDNICQEIAGGKSARSAIKESPIATDTFYDWLNNSEERAKRYARACEERADRIFDEMLEIADNTGKDMITLPSGKEVVNYEVVARDKIRLDTRKWALSKLQPKKYGDKLDLTSDNEKLPSASVIVLPPNSRDVQEDNSDLM